MNRLCDLGHSDHLAMILNLFRRALPLYRLDIEPFAILALVNESDHDRSRIDPKIFLKKQRLLRVRITGMFIVPILLEPLHSLPAEMVSALGCVLVTNPCG